MDKIITLKGREYVIGFDFGVMCKYAEIFGRELDINSFGKVSTQMDVLYAAISEFNDNVPDFKEFRRIAKNEFMKASILLSSCIVDFTSTPETDVEVSEECKESNP